MSKLTLDDIADLREYERQRDDFRRDIIALKKRRRVGVGPFVTFLFENRLVTQPNFSVPVDFQHFNPQLLALLDVDGGPLLAHEEHPPALGDQVGDEVGDGLALAGAGRPLDDDAVALDP